MALKIEAPVVPDSNPYVPGYGIPPRTFEQFQGINTTDSRPAIDDAQMAWCDGFMPIGEGNLRTLRGVGEAIYTAPGALTVVFYEFANIGPTPICVVFLSDGSIVQVNTQTMAVTTMAPAGTILNPSLISADVSQWGSQYIIIVADQTNGYWLWDGTTLTTAGGLGLQVTVLNGGTGYSVAPTVSVTGGSGTGTSLTANVANGAVISVSVVNAGSGYVIGDTVTVAFTGVGSGASASAVIMPFGIKGTSVETYQSRVWIADGAKITYSAPGSVEDFATSSGGGTFTSRDSFLRVGFRGLRQTNGFLYLLADSSINYLSGVQTSGTPPTTTFTNQNADPEIGTPWGQSIDVFSRNLVFANAFGAHVSYGGSVTKISEVLDGVYNSVPAFGGFTPSAAKAIIYGKKVWMILLPVIDQITGEQVNKLFMWNGKLWWSSQQDVPLTYVAHQEIESILTAYGTDGLSIYPLFARPSTAFTKRVQSKLWSQPVGYQVTKTATRLWGLARYYSQESPSLNISIDNQSGQSTEQYTFGEDGIPVFNGLGDEIPVFNASNDEIEAFSTGDFLAVLQPTAVAQQGPLIGLTLTTNAADVALISLMLQVDPFEYLG
jgi:hypothetical protein